MVGYVSAQSAFAGAWLSSPHHQISLTVGERVDVSSGTRTLTFPSLRFAGPSGVILLSPEPCVWFPGWPGC